MRRWQRLESRFRMKFEPGFSAAATWRGEIIWPLDVPSSSQVFTGESYNRNEIVRQIIEDWRSLGILDRLARGSIQRLAVQPRKLALVSQGK